MPLVLGMQQAKGKEGAAEQEDSLTASNALRGSGERAGRRARTLAGSTCEAPAPPESGSGMHLRSAQKRLLAAAAAEASARTDSGVGSSQLLDRTDSCGGPQRRSAEAAAAAPGSGGKRRWQQVQQEQSEQVQQAQVQQSQQQTRAQQSTRQPPAAAAAEPAAKRRRVARAGVPVPLPAYELRTFDRPSPPLRWVLRHQGPHLAAITSGPGALSATGQLRTAGRQASCSRMPCARGASIAVWVSTLAGTAGAAASLGPPPPWRALSAVAAMLALQG